MSLHRKVATNTTIQVIGKIMSAALVLVATALMTRYLGTKGYGEYSTAIAFLSFFGVISDMGLYTILSREISHEGADQSWITSNIFTLRLTVDIIVFSIVPLIALKFNYSSVTKQTIFLASIAFFLASIEQILESVFQKELRVDRISIAQILGNVVFLIACILAIKLSIDHTSRIFMAAMVLSNIATFGIVLFFVKKYVKLSFKFDKEYWRYVVKTAFPMSLAIIFNRIYFKLDTVILSMLKPASDVGVYNLPYRFLEVIIYMATIFVGIVFPILSRLNKTDKEKFKLAFRHSQDALISTAIPIAFGGWVLARPIINLLGGSEFSASVLVFRMLMFSVIVMFLNALVSHVIISIEKEKEIAKIHAFGAVIAIILYLIFIPLFSYIGAAASTFAVEFAMLVIGYVVIYKYIKYIPSFKIALQSIFSAVIMAGAVYGLMKIAPFAAMHNAISALLYVSQLMAYILAGAAVYGAVLYAVGGVDEEVIKRIII